MSDRSSARADSLKSRKRRISPPAATGVVLALALAAFVGWLWLQGEPPPQPVVKGDTAVATTAPEPERPPASAGAPAGTPPPSAPPPSAPPPVSAAPAPAPAGESDAAKAEKPAAPPPPPSTEASTPPPPASPPPATAPTPAPSPAAGGPPPINVPSAAAPAPAPPPAPAQPPPKVAAAPPVASSPSLVRPRPEATGPLPPVPDPALVQQSPHGPLPIIAADGRKPWQVYARPFEEADKRPRIAIMVADMGLSQAATQSAITRLPSAVTLAFAPYAGDLQTWIAQARAAGHEAVLQLPMEPLDYPHNDPGPRALLTSLKPSDNLDRLSWLLSRFTGYVGVTNYMGSKFTASTNDVRPILEVLASRGLLFVDSRSSARSVAVRVAADLGMPRAFNDRFLDNEASRTAIDARLEELERIALKNGVALGIGYPYPVTIDRIANWAPGLAAKNIALVPVSAIVNKQSE